MGLFSKFKPKKYYDKTLVTYIPLFTEIRPELARQVDSNLPKESPKLANKYLEDLVRNHYYEELRPPVNWNFRYTVFIVPDLPPELKNVSRFWDDTTAQIVNKSAYRQMCSDLRTMWKEQLLEEYPNYDRSKLEDGFENLNFDYYSEDGIIIVSTVLEKIMPIES